MFVPKLTTGSIIVRSLIDEAIDGTALDTELSSLIINGQRMPAWIKRHVDACGTSQLPARPGQRVSEFEVRLVPPSEAARLPLNPCPETHAAWYAATVIRCDECTDRDLLIDGYPLRVVIEIGSYALRVNTELQRPFLPR